MGIICLFVVLVTPNEQWNFAAQQQRRQSNNKNMYKQECF